MTRYLKLTTVILISAIILLPAGCAVGPDFTEPAAPDTARYTPAGLPSQTASAPVKAGEAQRFVPGEDIPEQWWTLFHSEKLNELIRMALADSPAQAAARAGLRQAQENLKARMGTAFYPGVDANVAYTYNDYVESPSRSSANQYNLYNASVNVSYNLDLFGGAKRELEGLQSRVDFQRYQLEAALLTVSSNVVTTAVKEASLREQLQATREILLVQEKQLGLIRQQFQFGAVPQSDVLAIQTQVAQTRATLPPLERQLAQTRHQLAVLAGRLPGEAASLPMFNLDSLALPETLPVSLPSSLVRQRPDIRASEALLHSASAQIGVATANLYPQIKLTGSFGSQSSEISDIFTGPTSLLSLGASLLQPIFHGGELRAKRRAAVAAYDQAAAQYRDTVLKAFQNVADVLRALDSDANALKAQAEAESSARSFLDLVRKQFQLGAVSYLPLLDAERQYQQARISLIQAQASRFADTAALFQALGGGWWNAPASAAGTENRTAE